jgi:(S)-citramalyl-CoA lyase
LSKFGVCPCQAPQDLPLAGFFTPGTWPNRFAKAAEIGADVLIIDLEDAVAPDDKPAARETALDFASQRKETANAVAIRINGLDTPPGIADVDALLASDAAPDYLVVPKTESAGHLQILDLGAATAWAPLAYVRSRLVLACALAGVGSIDSPFFDVHDTKGLACEAADAVAFGFPSKAAIHPGQVGAINDALTPTPEAVKHAEAVLAANTRGVGVVDEAVARKARRVLAAAGQ